MRRYVFTVAEMRAFEASLRERGISEESMMNAVGANVARRLNRTLKKRPDIKNLLLLAGPGHNGEDGRRAARAIRGLRKTTLEWPRDRERSGTLLRKLRGPTLVIDAIYGIGFRDRGTDPQTRQAVHEIARYVSRSKSLLVAIDVPSGLCEDGQVAEDFRELAAHATFCVTGPKLPQLESEGAAQSGALLCVDLGAKYSGLSPRWVQPAPSSLRDLWSSEGVSLRRLPRTAHKNTRGRILVVGGSLANGGAMRLAAEGALRAGAGYVTVVEPPNSRATEGDLIRASGEWIQRSSPASPEEWAELLRSHGTVVFGCGLPAYEASRSDELVRLWRPFFLGLAQAASDLKTVVVDGGGLAVFARWLKEHPSRPEFPIVFTPHPKEAADVLEVMEGATRPAAVLRTELFTRLRDAIRSTGIEGALLLKGAYPFAGAIQGEARAVFNIATDRLATAGSGDALSGAVAASTLKAQAASRESAAFGALALALAAQGRAARRLPHGALAREIARASGRAIEEIERAL